MNKYVVGVFSFSCVFLSLSAGAAENHPSKTHPFPEVIKVPNGFQPEGVVRGHGSTAYVGSLLSESIYKVDLRSGEGSLLVNKASTNPVVGIAYDSRSNFLFTAGGPLGSVSVFDAANGDKMAQFDFASQGTFINDGVVTPNAAYFTDSFAQVIYRIPLSKNGRLPASNEVETIPLTGDFVSVAGNFNSNGVEKGKKKDHLYLVNSATGKLYDVDGLTGKTIEVKIKNGNVISGDGLRLHENKLYVAQNFLNQVTELALDDVGMNATVTQVIANPNFRIPTTLASFGDALYAINARFDVAPPPFFGNPKADPTLEYELVKFNVEN